MAGSRPTAIDRSVVARARRGDSAAFRRIFDHHAAGVRRFLRDLLGDAASADEATQETFVRAFQRVTTLREDAKVGSWLFAIARNVARERYRSRKRAERADPLEGTGPAAPADPSPSPESIVLGREADSALAAALAELPDPRRAALLMRIDHGLGYDEIATAMGWSLSKVKNEIHRARLQLRSALAGWQRD